MRDKSVQVTLIQIDNYGPWTATLGDDREHKLQVLQAELYASIQKKFSANDGLVFFNRFDEMLAVTNGIGREQHENIQSEILSDFPVTVSMGVGVGKTPYEAQRNASKLLQKAGSAQSETRRAVLACEETLNLADAYVRVIHIDIDHTTETFTDRASAFETSIKVMSTYSSLMKELKEHDALLFFIGGDNFMGIANGVSMEEISEVLEHYRSSETELKCGIGTARTGRKAAELATMNLDKIRQDRNHFILATLNM
jgi:GTP cyclohydrolase IIa